jgi:hypothetical protein
MTLTISYPWIVRSYLGQSNNFSAWSMTRHALVMGFLFVGSAYLGQRILLDNWITWIVCVSGTMGVIVPVLVWIGLSTDARHRLIKRFGMLLPRKSQRY